MDSYYDQWNMRAVLLRPVGTTGMWADLMGDIYEVDDLTRTCQKKP